MTLLQEDRHPFDAAFHLTTISGTFTKDMDVPLGPHCFIGRESLVNNWTSYPFVEAYSTDEDLVLAADKIGVLSEVLLPALAEKLNSLNKQNYSENFWRIICLPWLLELIQKTWTTYTRLEKLKVVYGEKRVKIIGLKGKPTFEILDTPRFQELLFFDFRFNWWLDTKVAEIQLNENWFIERLEEIDHPHRVRPIETQKAKKNTPLSAFLRWIKYSMGYSDIGGIRVMGLLLSAYLNLLPKGVSRRKKRSLYLLDLENYFPKNYLELLSSLLLELLPKSFGENFNFLEKSAQKLLYVKGRIRLGTLDFWNEQEKVIWALAAEKGERIAIVQHGGEYGITDYNVLTNQIEMKQDYFISWGWLDPQIKGTKILPLSSPFHSKYIDKHRFEDNSLIVLGGGVRILNSRVHWWTRSSTPANYYRDAITFIDNLQETPKNSIVFKPYNRWASEIDTVDFIKNKFPNIKIHEGDFNKSLLSCRLVVFYSFGTTMNFTMAANVPTVVYLSTTFMRPNSYSRPFFQPLKECGILHDSPEDASRHINLVWNDVESWWSRSDVQRARLDWQNNFAKTSKCWWWEWVRGLTKL